MNFKLTKSKRQQIEFYGITCNLKGVRLDFDTLSTDRQSVENLCRLMNRGAVSEITAGDIIEDFIAE